MAYKVLYRKYRPDSFDKIIGQEDIVSILKNSVINHNFSHAYIFTGPRGTGKTSTAKVFAKALNCENPVHGEACCKCNNCIDFDSTPDIIEIDAASNNGVDEIRELRNNINLAPAGSKYKIYIIDEVHMLSSGAFNALLKTLEEPPEHAIFILATTEIYKVPITILSRCQRYDFKRISKTVMIEHLKKICETESIKYEDGVLEEIYTLSEGCLRDALSILDQLSKNLDSITFDYVVENYSIISNQTIEKLLDNIQAGNVPEIINIIEKYEDAGVNAQKLIKKIINYLEKIAIDIKLKKNNKYNFKTINTIIRELNECYIDARINENVYSIIKLSLIDQIDMNSSSLENKTTPIVAKEVKTMSDIKDNKDLSIRNIRINNCFVGANKQYLIDFQNRWDNLSINYEVGIQSTSMTPVAASDKNVILTIEDESLANLYNMRLSENDEINQKENIDEKLIVISSKQWIDEKNKYISKIKLKEQYQYIEEPVIINKDLQKAKDKANELFTENLIEIS